MKIRIIFQILLSLFLGSTGFADNKIPHGEIFRATFVGEGSMSDNLDISMVVEKGPGRFSPYRILEMRFNQEQFFPDSARFNSRSDIPVQASVGSGLTFIGFNKKESNDFFSIPRPRVLLIDWINNKIYLSRTILNLPGITPMPLSITRISQWEQDSLASDLLTRIVSNSKSGPEYHNETGQSGSYFLSTPSTRADVYTLVNRALRERNQDAFNQRSVYQVACELSVN